MSFTTISLLTVFLLSGVQSAIVVDFNCSTYLDGAWVYTPAAVNCEDTLSTAACKALYPETEDEAGWPTAGAENARPYPCYATGTEAASPMVPDMKTASIASCPKTCGYCCQTEAFNCPNVQFPRLNCNTITRTQCNSVTWRTIIAADCPSACGFCNQGGCVDAVTNCGNDLSICNTVGMQDFVNNYCQRTCGRCPSTTAASGSVTYTTASSGTGTCTSFAADSSTSCTAWAANGFCTNGFYSEAQRRARCATTCRLC